MDARVAWLGLWLGAALAAAGAAEPRTEAWSVVCWRPFGLNERWCEITMRLDWQRGEQRFIGAIRLRREGGQGFRVLLSGDRVIEYGRVAVDAGVALACAPDVDCEIGGPQAGRIERELRAGRTVHLHLRPAGLPTLQFNVGLDGYRAALLRVVAPGDPW